MISHHRCMGQEIWGVVTLPNESVAVGVIEGWWENFEMWSLANAISRILGMKLFLFFNAFFQVRLLSHDKEDCLALE